MSGARDVRACVTGASSGIGRELARRFAADHHDLILGGRDVGRLEALAAELRAAHGVAVDVVVADLARAGAAAAFVAELDRRDLRVGFLVNNAGFGLYGPFLAQDPAAQAELLQLNVVALTELTRLLAPRLVAARHGRILNVASTIAFLPGPMLAIYGASKAYVLSFSEALGNELAGSGVTVTCLCPGPTATAFGERSGFAMAERFAGRLAGAAAVARFGYDAMFRGEPVAIHGAVNRLMSESLRLAPRSVVTKLSGRVLSGAGAAT